MKRLLLSCLLLLGSLSAAAQDAPFHGVFNHLGLQANVGTLGLGFDVSAPLTKYLDVSWGVAFMPNYKVSGTVSVKHRASGAGLDDIKAEAAFARTTSELKVSCYPFGSAFFVAAGLSFGGRTIARLSAHSDRVAELVAGDDAYSVQIDKYDLKVDPDGRVRGELRVNGVRPYFGLGFGRLVPKRRLGCRVELGVQLHGKMQVWQDGRVAETADSEGGDDDISKIVESVRVYPVLRLCLTGRLF